MFPPTEKTGQGAFQAARTVTPGSEQSDLPILILIMNMPAFPRIGGMVVGMVVVVMVMIMVMMVMIVLVTSII